eukprot:752003-Hanusia_phi.AAC.1
MLRAKGTCWTEIWTAGQSEGSHPLPADLIPVLHHLRSNLDANESSESFQTPLPYWHAARLFTVTEWVSDSLNLQLARQLGSKVIRWHGS